MTKFYYANTKDPDMLYAVGMHISDPFFFIDQGDKKYIFLDLREHGVFKEHNADPSIELILLESLFNEIKTIPEETSWSNKLALFLVQKYNFQGTPIDVSPSLPLDMADYLRSKGVSLNVKIPFSPERIKKTPEEVSYIRESLLRTQTAFKWIEEILRESKIEGETLFYRDAILTSEFLKAEADRLLLEEDMVNSDGIIISSAQQAAIPHHPGHGPIKPHQTIVCDIFPRRRSNGYFADMTRTYVKGTPSDEVLKMYEAVKASQDKGFEIIRPGITGKEAYLACAQVLLDRGFHVGDGEGFNHGLSHGLGLEVHEAPLRGVDVFEPGNIVTVEPGLYYAKWGGIRIEDVVVVTENGCENLTKYPRELIIP